ncbi:hypothetical protein, partial [Tritonibacter mobilis]
VSGQADLHSRYQFESRRSPSVNPFCQHVLAVTGMWFNIKASELTRDFGITAETSTSFDEDGRVTLNDFEVTHSKYGKVGEVKDGVFYIATTNGTLVDPEVYFGNAAAN